MSDNREARDWFWVVILALFGTHFLVDYVYSSGELHHLLAGLGFLLSIPSAYFTPHKSSIKPSALVDWLALLGIIFLAASVLVRLL